MCLDPNEKNQKAFAGVGPGSYNMSMIDKKAEPKYSMGLKPAGKQDLSGSPGPNSYSLPSKVSFALPHSCRLLKVQERPWHPELIQSTKVENWVQVQVATLMRNQDKEILSIRKSVDFTKSHLSVRMGGKLRDVATEKRNFQPGPGTYDSRLN